jgi:hypothetical protein
MRLCTNVTATGAQAGVPVTPSSGQQPRTFQSSMTVSSGSGSATVLVQGSLDGTWWDTLGTMNITDTASDSVTIAAAAYNTYRANVTALTGTGAAVTTKGSN